MLKKSLSIVFLVITLCCISISSNSQLTSPQDEKFIEVSIQEVIIKPGDSVSRFFGDLKITLALNKTGRSVDCNLFLTTQLLGIQTLTPEDNQYNFDLQLADYKASGTLTMLINPSPGSFSKVSGNFTYTVVTNHQTFICKGDLIAWRMDQ